MSIMTMKMIDIVVNSPGFLYSDFHKQIDIDDYPRYKRSVKIYQNSLVCIRRNSSHSLASVASRPKATDLVNVDNLNQLDPTLNDVNDGYTNKTHKVIQPSKYQVNARRELNESSTNKPWYSLHQCLDEHCIVHPGSPDIVNSNIQEKNTPKDGQPRFLCSELNRTIDINKYPLYKKSIQSFYESTIKKTPLSDGSLTEREIWRCPREKLDDFDTTTYLIHLRSSFTKLAHPEFKDVVSDSADGVIKSVSSTDANFGTSKNNNAKAEEDVDITDLKEKYKFLFDPAYIFRSLKKRYGALTTCRTPRTIPDSKNRPDVLTEIRYSTTINGSHEQPAANSDNNSYHEFYRKRKLQEADTTTTVVKYMHNSSPGGPRYNRTQIPSPYYPTSTHVHSSWNPAAPELVQTYSVFHPATPNRSPCHYWNPSAHERIPNYSAFHPATPNHSPYNYQAHATSQDAYYQTTIHNAISPLTQMESPLRTRSSDYNQYYKHTTNQPNYTINKVAHETGSPCLSIHDSNSAKLNSKIPYYYRYGSPYQKSVSEKVTLDYSEKNTQAAGKDVIQGENVTFCRDINNSNNSFPDTSSPFRKSRSSSNKYLPSDADKHSPHRHSPLGRSRLKSPMDISVQSPRRSPSFLRHRQKTSRDRYSHRHRKSSNVDPSGRLTDEYVKSPNRGRYSKRQKRHSLDRYARSPSRNRSFGLRSRHTSPPAGGYFRSPHKNRSMDRNNQHPLHSSPAIDAFSWKYINEKGIPSSNLVVYEERFLRSPSVDGLEYSPRKCRSLDRSSCQKKKHTHELSPRCLTTSRSTSRSLDHCSIYQTSRSPKRRSKSLSRKHLSKNRFVSRLHRGSSPAPSSTLQRRDSSIFQTRRRLSVNRSASHSRRSTSLDRCSTFKRSSSSTKLLKSRSREQFSVNKLSSRSSIFRGSSTARTSKCRSSSRELQNSSTCKSTRRKLTIASTITAVLHSCTKTTGNISPPLKNGRSGKPCTYLPKVEYSSEKRKSDLPSSLTSSYPSQAGSSTKQDRNNAGTTRRRHRGSNKSKHSFDERRRLEKGIHGDKTHTNDSQMLPNCSSLSRYRKSRNIYKR